MSCSRYRDALADRAAGGPAHPEVEAHLTSCVACRAGLEELRTALAMADATFRQLVAEEPRPDLPDRIRRVAAEADEAGRHEARWPLAWAATLAGSVVAAAVLIGVSRSGSPLATPRPSPPVAGGETVSIPEHGSATSPSRERAVTAPSRRTRPPETPRAEPEVLVPPGEAEALLRFAASLEERTVAPGSLVVSAPSDPLFEPRAIELVPVDTVRLDSTRESDVEEGASP